MPASINSGTSHGPTPPEGSYHTGCTVTDSSDQSNAYIKKTLQNETTSYIHSHINIITDGLSDGEEFRTLALVDSSGLSVAHIKIFKDGTDLKWQFEYYDDGIQSGTSYTLPTSVYWQFQYEYDLDANEVTVWARKSSDESGVTYLSLSFTGTTTRTPNELRAGIIANTGTTSVLYMDRIAWDTENWIDPDYTAQVSTVAITPSMPASSLARSMLVSIDDLCDEFVSTSADTWADFDDTWEDVCPFKTSVFSTLSPEVNLSPTILPSTITFGPSVPSPTIGESWTVELDTPVSTVMGIPSPTVQTTTTYIVYPDTVHLIFGDPLYDEYGEMLVDSQGDPVCEVWGPFSPTVVVDYTDSPSTLSIATSVPSVSLTYPGLAEVSPVTVSFGIPDHLATLIVESTVQVSPQTIDLDLPTHTPVYTSVQTPSAVSMAVTTPTAAASFGISESVSTLSAEFAVTGVTITRTGTISQPAAVSISADFPAHEAYTTTDRTVAPSAPRTIAISQPAISFTVESIIGPSTQPVSWSLTAPSVAEGTGVTVTTVSSEFAARAAESINLTSTIAPSTTTLKFNLPSPYLEYSTAEELSTVALGITLPAPTIGRSEHHAQTVPVGILTSTLSPTIYFEVATVLPDPVAIAFNMKSITATLGEWKNVQFSGVDIYTGEPIFMVGKYRELA